MLDSLGKMLAKGVDNSLLRFGLGKGYLDLGEFARAAEHFQRCVGFDPRYSAAWKLLGRPTKAKAAYRQLAKAGNKTWKPPGPTATNKPKKK
ncbi:Conserved hypothetical protein [Pseudomonas brassicacearum subsp. brassicacearum NFM421]|uniref:Uncharacterized protein n=1 Tax=Pseudomonas brassicacearum (strain NFM421) TaxID=994484 RepID=F2KB20_PSEBN|nr:Conserved hypothetical protein [Pseudomonas brassicacearum subsp. brassicacearum NFM421]